MIQRLFVYGTLAPGRPNGHVLADVPGQWEPAIVAGILIPEGWGATLGYPALIRDENGCEIEGDLLTSETLADHWERLDQFEGIGYERVLTRPKLRDGRTVEAYVYKLKGDGSMARL